MKLSAIAPWFGSKRTLAPRIVEALGPHTAYWEPFCGSLAVLLAKPIATMETVNDLHGDLINLARVLQSENLARQLYEELKRTLMHEKLFCEAARRCLDRGRTPAADEPELQRAVDFMICSWFGRNGVAGTESYNQGFCVRYTKNGGHAATRWVSAVESIPEWHERLRGITILYRDGLDLIDKIEDNHGVVVYCDPPYVVKGAKYVYDFYEVHHRRLAEALSRFKKTRCVVSYYENSLVNKLYESWTKISCPVAKSLSNQRMRGQRGERTMAPEVLFINDHNMETGRQLF